MFQIYSIYSMVITSLRKEGVSLEEDEASYVLCSSFWCRGWLRSLDVHVPGKIFLSLLNDIVSSLRISKRSVFI